MQDNEMTQNASILGREMHLKYNKQKHSITVEFYTEEKLDDVNRERFFVLIGDLLAKDNSGTIVKETQEQKKNAEREFLFDHSSDAADTFHAIQSIIGQMETAFDHIMEEKGEGAHISIKEVFDRCRKEAGLMQAEKPSAHSSAKKEIVPQKKLPHRAIKIKYAQEHPSVSVLRSLLMKEFQKDKEILSKEVIQDICDMADMYAKRHDRVDTPEKKAQQRSLMAEKVSQYLGNFLVDIYYPQEKISTSMKPVITGMLEKLDKVTQEQNEIKRHRGFGR